MKNQYGVSMLEMMGVLAIAGILTASVWKLTDNALYRYRISQIALQVQSLQKNVSRFYAAKGSYTALDSSDSEAQSTEIKKLIDNSVVPHDMRAEEGKIRHAFGGEVFLDNVKYANEISNASTGFSIKFIGLSKKICIEVATISWPENDMANMISIKIGETKFVWPSLSSSDSDQHVLPVTINDAIDLCTGLGSESTQDITWEFR